MYQKCQLISREILKKIIKKVFHGRFLIWFIFQVLQPDFSEFFRIYLSVFCVLSLQD